MRTPSANGSCSLPGGPGAVAGVGLAAVIAVGLVWWATAPWGAGLSPDAIAYTAIAERIRDQAQIGYWLEPRTSSWPPLFPLVLAGLSTVLGSPVVDSARLLNALIAGATVVVVALLARRLLGTTWLRALAVVMAVLAQPLAFVAVRVWSEPLFNLLVLLTLLVLAGVPGQRPTIRSLVASALTVAAFSTRYAGLSLVPAGVAVLALWPRHLPRRQRVVHALWFGLPASAAAGLLVVWNQWRTGQASGPRWRPHQPFWHHAADAMAAIGQWLLPGSTSRAFTIGFGAALLLAVGAVLALSWRAPDPGDEAPPARTATIGVAPVLATFVGCYFAYMVYARTTSGFDPLNSRLMLPIFVPAMLLVLFLVERLAATRHRELSRALILALPLLSLVPLGTDGLDALRTSHDAGNEYTNAAVQTFVASPVLRQVPHDCDLLTNDPWLLWLAGFEAQLSPESNRQLAIPQSMQLEELPALAAGGNVCLAWMDTGSTVFYSPEQLGEVVDLQRIAGDGYTTIYRVGPRR